MNIAKQTHKTACKLTVSSCYKCKQITQFLAAMHWPSEIRSACLLRDHMF